MDEEDNVDDVMPVLTAFPSEPSTSNDSLEDCEPSTSAILTPSSIESLFSTASQLFVSTNTNNVLIPRRVRSYTISQKLEVLNYAKEHSISSTHRKFNIDRKCIREWRKTESDLLSLQSTSETTPLKRRRPGAGRRVKDQSFDEDLAKWLKAELELGRNPSRAQIQWKALEMAQQNGIDTNNDFKASTGWLEKFLSRHNFKSKPPQIDYQSSIMSSKKLVAPKDKMNAFVEFIQRLQNKHGYEHIYVAHKSSILIDSSGTLSLDSQVDSESPPANEANKLRVTIILTIKSDGQKSLPFIVLPKRPSNPFDLSVFTHKLHLISSESEDMNFDEELLIDYLKRVFNDKPTTSKRLILWNTFGCELNEELSQFLEKNKINNMLIPSSFDVFNEALNSELHKKFIDGLFAQHAQWKSSDECESVSNEKLGSLSMHLLLRWIFHSWQCISETSMSGLFASGEVVRLMNSLGVNMVMGNQFVCTNNVSLTNEISTVDETYQADYKRFLDKIIENIGIDGVAEDNSSSEAN